MDFHFVAGKRAFLRKMWTRDENIGIIFHFVASQTREAGGSIEYFLYRMTNGRQITPLATVAVIIPEWPYVCPKGPKRSL